MSSVAIACSVWLDKFLKRRGLREADQRSLYAYHCRQEEYIDLAQTLRTASNLNLHIKDRSVCACFVMLAAEWYRREYRSGYGWSWEEFWRMLGASLSPIEISRAVPKGLEDFWVRPLHFYESGHRDFIGSLFCEGGLPFQVLREDGNRFQILFNRLLAQHDEMALMGINTLQHVKQSLAKTNFPQVFSSPSSIDLIAAMVEGLIALVRDFNLVDEAEPVEKLDSLNPKWREGFPLPLDLETGRDLINGMLRTATHEGKKQRNHNDGWGCVHYWLESNPNVLKTQISLPEKIDFKLDSAPSTTRLELSIFEGGKALAHLGSGYAIIDGNKAIVRLRSRKVLVNRVRCGARLSLVASEGGAAVASIAIAGSVVALGEVPLGFARDSEHWVLCGEGTFSTASKETYIVVPMGTDVDVSEHDIDTEVTYDLSVLNHPAILVSGKATLNNQGDELFRIRTGHMSASLGLDLVGDQLPWSTKPANCFLGLPEVYWPVGTGELQQQGSDIFINKQCPTKVPIPETLGVQWVSVRNKSGEALLRRKVGILPRDFRLELRSGVDPTQGSLDVFTSQRCMLQIVGGTVEQQRIKHDDYTEYRFKAKGLPPETLSIRVTPNLESDPIVIEVPFPAFGCMGYDASGNPLKRDLSLDQLLGSRLSLFSPPNKPTRFTLELALLGRTARNARYQWRHTVSQKPLEIRLFDIREQVFDLLSLESGIDQVVELTVLGGGARESYRIRRYAAELVLDNASSTVSLANSYKLSNDLPKPVLMLLHDPMREVVPLTPKLSEGVETGVYELPNLIERDGPWLILPKRDSSINFRPKFLAGNRPELSAKGSPSLQKAVITFDPSASESTFTSVLDSMAVNPMHNGWQYLQSLYRNYSYLPMATFEVWKALLNHPSALAMALFKFEMDTNFLDRLEYEFPVFWEAFPIRYLHLAGKRFAAFLKVNDISQSVIDSLMERMYHRLGDAFPAYGSGVQHFLEGKGKLPEANIPIEVFRVVINEWYQELIRNRSEATWPEYGGARLKDWYQNFEDSAISFEVGGNYRNATVYLPVFAAAVASGDAVFSDVFPDFSEATFFLRQVRDFDSKWFNAVYQYCLLNRVTDLHKEELIND